MPYVADRLSNYVPDVSDVSAVWMRAKRINVHVPAIFLKYEWLQINVDHSKSRYFFTT